jgi:hypothetical protein
MPAHPSSATKIIANSSRTIGRRMSRQDATTFGVRARFPADRRYERR